MQTKQVKLVDGPLADTTINVPAGSEKIRIGPFFTYTYAGKIGRQEHWAIQPRSRRERRLCMFLIGKTGRDPRVEASQARQTPYRKPKP